ncbi:MAG: HPF/RaiA family ribosome-associated protein [Flavobacteriales bacterium]|nr:HPF/RaiA family ribosome-associated protein [Flavobacteriales bacterium]
MIVLLNTDHNVNGKNSVSGPITAMIEKELKRFSSYVTRVEAHLSDENAAKEGQNDKRCVLEARVEGMQPIAVSSSGNTRDQAVKGAVEKLKAALDTKIGRRRNNS